MEAPAPPRVRCFSDIKLRFVELLRGYYYQLTVGCGSSDCKNPRCRSCPGFQPLGCQEDAFKEATALTSAGFRVPKVYYFCRNLPYPVDVLHLDVIDLLAVEESGHAGSTALMGCITRGFQCESLCYSFLKGYGAPATEEDSGLDVDSLFRAFDLIRQDEEAHQCLATALHSVAETLEAALSASGGCEFPALQLRPLLILFLWPGLADPNEHPTLEILLRVLCGLPLPPRRLFIAWLSRLGAPQFQFLVVHMVQNFLTLRLLTAQVIERVISHATIVLGMLYQANSLVEREGKIDYKEFYNDGVNRFVDLRQDYRRWYETMKRGLSGENWETFSFTHHPFILDPASKAKVLGLNANSQQSEVQSAAVANLFLPGLGGFPRLTHEDLVCVLRVDRHDLVQSSLVQVAMLEVMNRLDELKKPLRVQFLGEEGIDEGGVKKEFFQLLTTELFDPQFGMFKYDEVSHCHWFNQHSFENAQEFRLIGIMFGLAIYNSVILEIRFPMAIYKKMLGLPVGLADLEQLDPELHKGLRDLLNFADTDAIEEVYGRTFALEAEVYGAQVLIPLKANGANIPLTKDNREEYVQLHAAYILEDSIRKQFNAFNSGFQDVCGVELLKIFRPEELELLICGSPVLDFDGLEKQCRYDGFTKDSPIIRQFWEIVHAMSEVEQKKLLRFCTGSDRVPIKGLASILFVIVRNGDDSEMLPTSHTCFNHLLLPEYSSKEKLRTKLMLAMNNCTGFGLM
eukprot:GGOE01019661.1.p1 GENE.GGOE01019661.1~~GGOE01019661.1.p1  ORF type:complete len:750 (-),score=242.83 GGOE01019661.1:27-2246(-)